MSIHDDVIKWKHFPRNWPFVRGIHRSPVNSPHKGQWREALMFSLNCVWINGWVNNREAGDLRRYRAHYDVIAMYHCYWDVCVHRNSYWTRIYLSFLKLDNFGYAIAHLLRYFCHWTFVYNIGKLNIEYAIIRRLYANSFFGTRIIYSGLLTYANWLFCRSLVSYMPTCPCTLVHFEEIWF